MSKKFFWRKLFILAACISLITIGIIPVTTVNTIAEEDADGHLVSAICRNDSSMEFDEEGPSSMTGEAAYRNETLDQDPEGARKISMLSAAPSNVTETSGSLSETITWELENDGTMIISGSGNISSYITIPWSNSVETIKKVVVEEGVTGLPPFIFDGCNNLTSVSLPEGYKYILKFSFTGCTSLKDINLPDSLEFIDSYAFDADNTTVISQIPSYLSKDDEGNYAILYDVPVTVKYSQTEARKILALVNKFRTDGNAWYWDSETTKKSNVKMPSLVYDYGLEEIAMQRAAEIAFSFSHTRPCSSGYGDGSWISCKASDGTTSYGENNAACFGTPDAQYAFDIWKEEDRGYGYQGHRLNMLGNYEAIGLGCVTLNGTTYWVMELGDPSSVSYKTPVDSDKKVNIKITPNSVNYYDEYVPETLRQPIYHQYEYIKETLHVHLKDAWPGGRSLALEGEYLWDTGDHEIAEVYGDAVTGVSLGETTLNYYYQFKAPAYIGLSGTLIICKPSYKITGSNRYATCAYTAAMSFPDGADEVIMVTGNDFPDALSASAYAGAKNCPLLMTTYTSLPEDIEYLLTDYWKGSVKKVTFIGGGFTQALKNSLRSCGVETIDDTTFVGKNRYETAALVCEKGLKEGLFTSERCVLATGLTPADALSFSPWSYRFNIPLLLVNDYALDNKTSGLLKKFDQIYVAGGEGVIPTSRLTSKGINVSIMKRFAGANRYSTAIEISRAFVSANTDDPTLPYHTEPFCSKVGFVSGLDKNYPDGLISSMLMGRSEEGEYYGPVLLINENGMTDTVLDYASTLKDNYDPLEVYYLGEISDSLIQKINLTFGCETV